MVVIIYRRSQHADFKFPQQDGTGIARLIPHASAACVELLTKLLAYNPDDRYSTLSSPHSPVLQRGPSDEFELSDRQKKPQQHLSPMDQPCTVSTFTLSCSLRIQKAG